MRKCVMCGQREPEKDSVLCKVCHQRPAHERAVVLKAYLDTQAKMLLKGGK